MALGMEVSKAVGGVAGGVLGAAAGNLANFALGALFGTRRDPDVQFCYTVEIDGITLGMFAEASGIKWSMDAPDVIKEGGNNGHEIYLPTRAKFDPLVLKRGFCGGDSLLFSMIKELYDETKPIHKYTIDVVVLKRQSNTGVGGLVGLGELGRFTFQECFVQEWAGPSFNAKTSDVAVESVTFKYSYLEFAAGGPLATALGAVGGAIGGAVGAAIGGAVGTAAGKAISI